MKRALAGFVLLLPILLIAYLFHLAGDIAAQSTLDQARPADVIVVLGAAEYNGKPSPVLQARLNHALMLYEKRLAPYILTTGGAGGDPKFTEGEVGRAYLIQHGVRSEAIIAEPTGSTTAQSLTAAGETMHTENSYKFTNERLDALLTSAGFTTGRRFLDAQSLFAVTLASAL